jgi:transposase
MRLQVSKSKNSASLYVIKTVYIEGKEHTKIVEKLGTEEQLRKTLNGRDPYEWAKEYVEKLNKQEKEQTQTLLIPFEQSKQIIKDEQRSFNCGYLFLQQIYNELKLPKLCKEISGKYKYQFDLDSILSRLVYSRIIYPSSKKATCELSKRFIEQPKFDLHQIYRALEVLSKETDFIQAQLYKNSLSVVERNTNVIYYDCTNYFFETEQENGLKQYGYSKEHRPNPIVQMGLFMDSDGIPISFCINKGNTNEQTTLQPLEQKLLNDFELSKFVVCTDAGLSSVANKKFNNVKNRAFITTQPIKKLKSYIKEWALSPNGWQTNDNGKEYDISEIEDNDDLVYYKEQWFKEDGLEQKLIVTYSSKYKKYQRQIRNSQIERAKKAIETNKSAIKKSNQNDYKRFIEKSNVTKDGELAENELYSINNNTIENEEMYDGFYAVCTNLEDKTSEIIKINKRRWEIEECFRIMKSEFKARPVYLSRDDRIKAHFLTCFISLIVYRMLEKRLDNTFTCEKIIDTLREMNVLKTGGVGYIPTYIRNELTDELHEKFEFRTDYEIIPIANMKNILKSTKK